MYTSKEILELEDLYDLQDTHSGSGIPFTYEMTEGEIGWYRVVKGKYGIADWIDKNTDGNFILTFDDCEEMSKVLQDDGMSPKAVMLSDYTALQRLFFWLCYE